MIRLIDKNGDEQVTNLIDYEVVGSSGKEDLDGERVPFGEWRKMNEQKRKA